MRSQATLVDPVQAMRVVLAIRWSVPVSEVSPWRARIAIHAESPGWVVPISEEMLAWQR